MARSSVAAGVAAREEGSAARGLHDHDPITYWFNHSWAEGSVPGLYPDPGNRTERNEEAKERRLRRGR